MNKEIAIPLGIKDDIQELLRQGIPYYFLDREDRYQNIKIIQELKMQVESKEMIKTDSIEENLKISQYIFFFRVGERQLTLIEDLQVDLTILYATDDYGDKIGIISLQGRPFNLQGYFYEALDFQLALDKGRQEKNIAFDDGIFFKKAVKPCHLLNYCPYGPLVENYPIGAKEQKYAEEYNYYWKYIEGKGKVECDKSDTGARIDYNRAITEMENKGILDNNNTCKINGHKCPVYYVCTPFYEAGDITNDEIDKRMEDMFMEMEDFRKKAMKLD